MFLKKSLPPLDVRLKPWSCADYHLMVGIEDQPGSIVIEKHQGLNCCQVFVLKKWKETLKDSLRGVDKHQRGF